MNGAGFWNGKLNKAVKQGRLADPFSLLDSTKARVKDRKGYAKTKADFRQMDADIVLLESNDKMRDKTAERIGYKAAAIVSAAIALLIFLIMLAMRLQ